MHREIGDDLCGKLLACRGKNGVDELAALIQPHRKGTVRAEILVLLLHRNLGRFSAGRLQRNAYSNRTPNLLVAG